MAVGAALAVACVMSGFALLVKNSENDAKRSVAERYAARTALTASFARSYIDDLASRERSQAERLLAGTTVDKSTFEQVVHGFDFDAAVLLDEQGRLLQVWPEKPEMLGTDMTSYAHLRAAVTGEVGVSSVVPSAARQIAVTAVAVPFDSPAGRRVFSGAFSAASTPLGSYFNSVSSLKGSGALLIDSNNAIVASGHVDGTVVSHVTQLHEGVQEVNGPDGPVTAAVAPVDGTPWRVVLSAPSAELFATVSHTQWAPWILWSALAVLGTIAVVMLAYLMSMRARATMTARTDLLTELPNRRAMDDLLTRTVADAARHEQPLAVLMVDLDHFKAVNDSLGHRGGDEVLQKAAQKLRETLRAGDVAGRWGGEEFIVVLPHTSSAGAAVVAERLRAAIAMIDVPLQGAVTKVTASIGVAVLEGDDVDALVGAADDALYCAKAAGRNCVIRAAVSAPSASHVSLV